jgi:hypothetical protein
MTLEWAENQAGDVGTTGKCGSTYIVWRGTHQWIVTTSLKQRGQRQLAPSVRGGFATREAAMAAVQAHEDAIKPGVPDNA